MLLGKELERMDSSACFNKNTLHVNPAGCKCSQEENIDIKRQFECAHVYVGVEGGVGGKGPQLHHS